MVVHTKFQLRWTEMASIRLKAPIVSGVSRVGISEGVHGHTRQDAISVALHYIQIDMASNGAS